MLDDEESDASTTPPTSPPVGTVRRSKFDDEEGDDSDVCCFPVPLLAISQRPCSNVCTYISVIGPRIVGRSRGLRSRAREGQEGC